MSNLKISLKSGETLFEEGQKSDYMYIVATGAIQISRHSKHGRVILTTLEPGDFFGEMAIVARSRRSARAVALMDSQLTAVHGSQLETLLTTQPDVAAELVRTLVKRLHHTSDQLVGEREKLGLVLTDQVAAEDDAELSGDFWASFSSDPDRQDSG